MMMAGNGDDDSDGVANDYYYNDSDDYDDDGDEDVDSDTDDNTDYRRSLSGGSDE